MLWADSYLGLPRSLTKLIPATRDWLDERFGEYLLPFAPDLLRNSGGLSGKSGNCNRDSKLCRHIVDDNSCEVLEQLQVPS